MEMSLSIKNLIPSLLELGKIKIGKKGKVVRGTFRMPEKLDHFIITTTEKDDADNFIHDTELMNKIMSEQKTEKLTTISVILLYNDIELNFVSRYICYNGMTKWCSGNGESAMRLSKDKVFEQIECPCERCGETYLGEDGKGRGKCKVSGCLSVLIKGAEVVGGVWKFRTTGYNSVRAIIASLLLIKNQTGGLLAGLPLEMIIMPKRGVNPLDGKPVNFHVVTLVYRGTPEKLRETAFLISQKETEHRLKIGNMETEVRKMLTASVDEEVIGDELEHAEEFHPEDIASDTVTNDKKLDPSEIQPPEDRRELPKKRKKSKKINWDNPQVEQNPELKITPPIETENPEKDGDKSQFSLFD